MRNLVIGIDGSPVRNERSSGWSAPWGRTAPFTQSPP